MKVIQRIWISIDKIVVDERYAAMYEPLTDEEWHDLFDDIRATGGILVPLRVAAREDGCYVLLSGHHRLKAAKLCGITEVEVQVEETIADQTSALFDNVLRRQMTPEKRRLVASQRGALMQTLQHERLLPALKEKYEKGQLTELGASFLTELPLEVQTALYQGLYGEITPTQAAMSDELQEKLDIAMQKLDDAETAKANLADIVRETKDLLQKKDKDLDDLTKKLRHIETEVRRRIYSADDGEDLGESEEELEESTIVQDMSREAAAKEKKLEAATLALEAAERQLKDNRAKLHIVQLIMLDMRGRYRKFLEVCRSPEVLMASLDVMMLGAQALERMVDATPWDRRVVTAMRERARLVVTVLLSAIRKAKTRAVDFDSELQAVSALASSEGIGKEKKSPDETNENHHGESMPEPD